MPPLTTYEAHGTATYLRRPHEDGVVVENFTALSRLRAHHATPPTEAHRHETLEIHYVARGQQHQTLSGRTYLLTPGDVLVAQPGELHYSGLFQEKRLEYDLSIDLRGPKGRFLGFRGAEAEAFRDSLRRLPPFFATGNELKGPLDGILALYARPLPHKGLALMASVAAFLVDLIDASQRGAKRPVSAPIARVARLIREGLGEKGNAAQWARAAGLTPSGLRQRFTRELGMSPKEFESRERLEAAGRLLRATERSVTDIALSLGYSSSQHFAKQFRLGWRCTPREYRGDARAGDHGRSPTQADAYQEPV